MDESQKMILLRLGVFTIWVALCVSFYPSELPKAFLLGIGFGIPIWTYNFKCDERFSRTADAIIAGSFCIILATFILIFRLFEFPLLTAGLAIGLILSLSAVGRYANRNARDSDYGSRD